TWFTWMAPLFLVVIVWGVRDKAKWPLACLLVFVAGVLPSLGLVPFDYQRYSTVADRYAYLAMLAPAVALAWVLARYPRTVYFGVAGAALAAMAVLSAVQTRPWRNTDTLFTYTLDRNPRSPA